MLDSHVIGLRPGRGATSWPLTPRATSNNMRIQHISISKLDSYIILVISMLHAYNASSCWFDAGLASKTIGQHQISIGRTCCLFILVIPCCMHTMQADVGLMLDQRHRRWANIKLTLTACIVYCRSDDFRVFLFSPLFIFLY